MFPGLVTTAREPLIAQGLPSLNAAMIEAQINTPRRIAAFLTTLRFESWIIYNQKQLTQTRTYYGRGFIQLTGRESDPQPDGTVMNYTAASKYLGVDFVAEPDLALDLRYSARIATWYWTVNRDCNPMADRLDMGAVNAAIGYPRKVINETTGETNDDQRCKGFAQALKFLTGVEPTGIDCTR